MTVRPTFICDLNKRFSAQRTSIKNLNKDGHLITEDSVLPTTAPGGAPEQNRCYQTPATLLILPLAPASLARSAHLAPLTSLRPRWGLALFGYCSVGGPATVALRGLLDHAAVDSS